LPRDTTKQARRRSRSHNYTESLLLLDFGLTAFSQKHCKRLEQQQQRTTPLSLLLLSLSSFFADVRILSKDETTITPPPPIFIFTLLSIIPTPAYLKLPGSRSKILLSKRRNEKRRRLQLLLPFIYSLLLLLFKAQCSAANSTKRPVCSGKAKAQ